VLRLGAARPPLALGVAVAIGGVAAITGLIYALREVMPAVSTGVLYLLVVLAVSTFWGLRLGLATSVLSAAAFNFFHIPPTGRFTIADEENWVALVVYLVAAVLASSLAELARARAEDAEMQRREAEEAVAKLEAMAAERERLQADAVEARALRRSDELKTALLRSVSHDLRSPLTAILAAGEALGSPALTDEDRAELAGAVTGEAGRLSRLVDQLLDLSRLEAGAAEPRRDWSSVEEIARAAVDGVAKPPAEGFRVKLDPHLPLIRVDAAQLERALGNVLDNSSRYAGGRHVSVRARVVGSRLVMRIVDGGRGISQTQLERIFDAFEHGENQGAAPGPDGQRGSGLGLAIAKGFVEANGGRIWAESLPGQGTAIVIEFPVEEQPEVVAEPRPKAARER
jgi:two-component system sensor histidine kinase KdpD